MNQEAARGGLEDGHADAEDPRAILEWPPGVPFDEAALRARYLELVRRFPPSRDPERFARIRRAYDALRDPVARLRARLFDFETTDSLQTIAAEHRARLLERRPSADVLRALAEVR